MSLERFLVAGASGQVGGQIIELLGRDRCLPASRRDDHAGWISLDLAALAASPKRANELLDAHAVSGVFCPAGMTDVEQCETEEDLAMAVNCDGPAALAGAAWSRGLPFVYFSTEYIFDGRDGPYGDESLADPISIYGKSKWKGELAVLHAHPDALILRTTVVYGRDPREKNFLYGLRSALLDQRSFRVASDQISTPTYNRDLAEASLALVRDKARGVFNVCGPERLSRLEFAVQAARAMGLDTLGIVGAATADLKRRAARPLDAGLSTGKLRQLYPRLRMRGVTEAIQDWTRYGLQINEAVGRYA